MKYKMILFVFCLTLSSCLNLVDFYTYDGEAINTELIKDSTFKLSIKVEVEETQKHLQCSFVFENFKDTIVLKDFYFKINSLKDTGLVIFYATNEESILFGEKYFNSFKPIKLILKNNIFFIEYPYKGKLDLNAIQLTGSFYIYREGAMMKHVFEKELVKTKKIIYTAPIK